MRKVKVADDRIRAAMHAARGNKAAAARMVGMETCALRKRWVGMRRREGIVQVPTPASPSDPLDGSGWSNSPEQKRQIELNRQVSRRSWWMVTCQVERLETVEDGSDESRYRVEFTTNQADLTAGEFERIWCRGVPEAHRAEGEEVPDELSRQPHA